MGYAGYDTVRYNYQSKIPFSGAPEDDRRLPDLHFGMYNDVIVFDNAVKMAYVVSWVHIDKTQDMFEQYRAAKERVRSTLARLKAENVPSLKDGV